MPTLSAVLEDFPAGLSARLVTSFQKEDRQQLLPQQQQQSSLSLETPYSLLLHDSWQCQKNARRDLENDPPTKNAAATTTTSVPTASALLSCPMDAHTVQTIRREIAHALHRQTACGQQQQRMMGKLNAMLSVEQQQQQSPRGPTGFVSVAAALAWQQSLARPLVQWRGQNAGDHQGSDEDIEVVNTLLTVHGHHGSHPPGWTWGQVYHISSEDAFATVTSHLLLPSLVGDTAASASIPDITVHYLVPAYLSPMTLAQTIQGIAPQFLHQIRIDTYRDDHDLALAAAQVEFILQNDGGGQRPWWVVAVLPSLSIMTSKRDGPRSSSSSSWRHWDRLVRLYHGIVVLLTPSAACKASTPIHLHLDQGGHRLTCQQHIDVEKAGQSVTLMPQSSSDYLSMSR